MTEKETLAMVIKIAGECEEWLTDYISRHLGEDANLDWSLNTYMHEGSVAWLEDYYKEKYGESLTKTNG